LTSIIKLSSLLYRRVGTHAVVISGAKSLDILMIIALGTIGGGHEVEDSSVS